MAASAADQEAVNHGLSRMHHPVNDQQANITLGNADKLGQADTRNRTSGMSVMGSVACVASSMTSRRKVRPSSRGLPALAHVATTTCAFDSQVCRQAEDGCQPVHLE